jgi:hypothetical protein
VVAHRARWGLLITAGVAQFFECGSKVVATVGVRDELGEWVGHRVAVGAQVFLASFGESGQLATTFGDDGDQIFVLDCARPRPMLL